MTRNRLTDDEPFQQPGERCRIGLRPRVVAPRGPGTHGAGLPKLTNDARPVWAYAEREALRRLPEVGDDRLEERCDSFLQPHDVAMLEDGTQLRPLLNLIVITRGNRTRRLQI